MPGPWLTRRTSSQSGSIVQTWCHPVRTTETPCVSTILMSREMEMPEAHLQSVQVGRSSRRGPLGNHQLAAILFFQFHREIKGLDGAFHLVITGRLGGNALEPQSRLREQSKH